MVNLTQICLCLVFAVNAVNSVDKVKVQREMLCADPECTEAISYANTLLAYNNIDKDHISFKKGERLAILQKPIPEDKHWGYWYACVIDPKDKVIKINVENSNSRSGLVPSNLLREFKKFHKNSDLLRVLSETGRKKIAVLSQNATDTEKVLEPQELQSIAGGVAAEVGNNGPRTPYDVVDGTTFYEGINGDSFIKSTATEKIIVEKSTPLPALAPSKVQNDVPPAVTAQVDKASIENDEEDEGGDEEDEEEEDGDEDEEDEESIQVPISNTIDSSGPTSSEKRVEINPSPTLSATETVSNIEATETPQVSPIVSTENVVGGLKADQKNIDFMNSILALDSALNSEPGRSAEHDDLVLKQFSGTASPPAGAQAATFSKNENIPEEVNDLGANEILKTSESNNEEFKEIDLNATEAKIVNQTELSQSDTSAEHLNVSLPNENSYSPHSVENKDSEVNDESPLIDLPGQEIGDREIKAESRIIQKYLSNKEHSNEEAIKSDSEEIKHLEEPLPTEPPLISPPAENSADVIPPGENLADIIPPNVENNITTAGTPDVDEPRKSPENGAKITPANIENDPGAESTFSLPGQGLADQLPMPTENLEKNVPKPENETVTESTAIPVPEPSSEGTTDNSESMADVYILNPESSTPTDAPAYDNVPSDPPIAAPDNVPSDPPIAAPDNVPSDPPIAAPDNVPEYPQAVPTQAPLYSSGHIYPGLIPKTVPTIANEVNHVKPVTEDDSVPAVTDQPSAPVQSAVGEQQQNLVETNEANSVVIPMTDSQQSEISSPSQVEENIPEPTGEGVAFVEQLTPQFPDRNVEPEENVQESSFSSFSSLFAGLLGSGSVENSNMVPSEDIIPSKENEAVPFGECKTGSSLESECIDEPSPPHLFDFFEKTVPPTSYTSLYLIITSITVLVFTLGYYFLEQTRRDGPLVAKVNQLTHELQVATSQLQNRGFDTIDEQQNLALLMEIEELKSSKADLELQLETVTEAGLEQNKMLSDLFAQQEGFGAVLKSVEQLQGQLNAQQIVIDNMNISLAEKSEENKVLQAELLAAQEKSEGLEERLAEMRENIDQLLRDKESAIWELESRNNQLESDLLALAESKRSELAELKEEKTKQIRELSNSLDEVNKKLAKSESEFRALDATIKTLQIQNSVDVHAIYDVGLIKAELERTRTDKEALQERLQDEEGARQLLEDHAKKIDAEVAELRSSFQLAEKEKIEAETRLTVLSNYFKEKEAHLQKELGLQEAMWVQKQGDDTTVYEQLKSLHEEVENYNFDSLQYSNEGISVTNSLSSMSMCTDPPSSISNLPSFSVSQDSRSSSSHALKPRSFDSPEQPSLPLIPLAKPRLLLTRRKSSADFEARLGCVESMMAPKPQIISRPIPDDLMKLQELKTVRASPFRDLSLSPEPNSIGSTTDSLGVELSCIPKLKDKLNLLELSGDLMPSNSSGPGSDCSTSVSNYMESSIASSFSELVETFEKNKKPQAKVRGVLGSNIHEFDGKISPIKTKVCQLVQFLDSQKESNNQGCEVIKINDIKRSVRCAKLIDKFENIKMQNSSDSKNNNNLKIPTKNDLLGSMTAVEDVSEKFPTLVDIYEKPPVLVNKHIDLGGAEELTKDFPKSLIPFATLCSASEKGVPYDCNAPQPPEEPSSCNQVALPSTAPPISRTPQSDKSDSEDSQSITKECDLSTATLEFDIKVVANASNMKKLKKKSSRQKNGAQNDVLKKEIIDQERGLKGRIATLEKKAHENWVAARQAERRLEESKQEAGQLRNMITLIEKSNVTEADGKITPRHAAGELNGDSLHALLPDGTSPLGLPPLPPSMLPPGFMPPFMPPPMEGFMPPPPFLSGDHRPPPLGRMSSPPLNRYSPSSVDYSYDRLSSPPPLSPPVRDYRSPPGDGDRYLRSPLSPWKELSPRSFRPVTSHRDSHKSYQGSNPNSAHSSSESLHKPAKRVEKYSRTNDNPRK